MYQPCFAAIDGIDVAGADGIERERGPGRLQIAPPEKRGRADVGRLHALHFRGAGQRGADRPANGRTSAVASDKKVGAYRDRLVAVEPDTLRGHALGRLLKTVDLDAIEQREAGD